MVNGALPELGADTGSPAKEAVTVYEPGTWFSFNVHDANSLPSVTPEQDCGPSANDIDLPPADSASGDDAPVFSGHRRVDEERLGRQHEGRRQLKCVRPDAERSGREDLAL